MSYTGLLLGQTLKAAEQHAQGKARQVAVSALVLAAAAFAAGCAAVFASIALFLALSPAIGPAGAGMTLAFGWFVIAAALAAFALARRQPAPATGSPLPSQASVVSALEHDARSIAPVLGVAAGIATGIAAFGRK